MAYASFRIPILSDTRWGIEPPERTIDPKPEKRNSCVFGEASGRGGRDKAKNVICRRAVRLSAPGIRQRSHRAAPIVSGRSEYEHGCWQESVSVQAISGAG